MVQNDALAETRRPIVVGVGLGSDTRSSRSVLSWGALAAHTSGRPLFLVHVSSPMVPVPAVAFLAGASFCPAPKQDEDDRARATRELQKLTRQAAQEFPGIDVSALILTGNPRTVIPSLDTLAHRLVLGAPPGPARHTYAGLRWTRRIAQTVQVPVTLVPRSWKPGPIAAITCGRASDPQVVRHALTLAEDTKQQVVVVDLADSSDNTPRWDAWARMFDTIDESRALHPTVGVQADVTSIDQLPFSLAASAATIVTGRRGRPGRHPTPIQRAVRTLSWMHSAPLITVPY